ncbi:MAG TPA: hypothetical protein VMA77_20100 [Solirubrobacteraceae bacterium]|nr:hypothetical protein [Solirubrobacteraceae bacterium]
MLRALWIFLTLFVAVFLIIAVLVASAGHSHCVLKGYRCVPAGTVGGWSPVAVAIALVAIVVITGLVLRQVARPRPIAH